MTWSASASSDDSSTWVHLHTNDATSASNDQVTCNGWWVQGIASAGTDIHTVWRIQYAYFPAQVAPENTAIPAQPITIHYAPICEMGEVDDRFPDYVRRLREDPQYREEQLRAQERLFAEQHECPLWLMDGLRLFHRLIENNIGLPQIREAMKFAEQVGPIGPELTVYGVAAKYEETVSLRELLQYSDERILDLHEHHRRLLEGHERFLQQVAQWETLPCLSAEQQKLADESALRLLREVLSPSEAEGLIKDGHIKIPSMEDPEIIYLVKRNPNERIEVYRKDRLQESLCIFFRESMHRDDIVLSKIMMAKYNERELLEIANHFPVAIAR